jgi:preprotein translocase subunit SecA
MRLFASPRMTAMLQKHRPPEGEPFSAKILNKSIETAQKRIEQRNYTMRKHTLEYDDVINKQRKEVYAFRNEMIHAQKPIAIAEELLEIIVRQTSELFLKTKSQWDLTGYEQALMDYFPVTFETKDWEDKKELEEILDAARKKVIDTFYQKLDAQKEALIKLRPDLSKETIEISPQHVETNEESKIDNVLQGIVRSLMIRKIDSSWQEHLLGIDHLRADVHMRTVGQKDPLLEFKHESFAMFERFFLTIRKEICRDLFRFEILPPPPPQERGPASKISSLARSS